MVHYITYKPPKYYSIWILCKNSNGQNKYTLHQEITYNVYKMHSNAALHNLKTVNIKGKMIAVCTSSKKHLNIYFGLF
jgi:hypothetical protein